MNDKTAPKPEETQIEVLNSDNNEDISNDRGLQTPPQGGNEPPPAPEPPQDGANPPDARAAIAAKFKRVREDKEPPVETTGDFIDPSQTYGQVAAKPAEPPPTNQNEPPPSGNEPAPAPAKRKVKVNGQDREITEEEYHAAAQKALAADDYLDQAKSKYKDAQQLLETTRVHVSRQNPAEPPAPTATEGNNLDGQHNPANPLKEVVEQIQYGDPDKATELLGKTIVEAATAAVKSVSTNDRVQLDIAADLRAHDDFVKANPDLASDPIAHSVIRDGLLDGYREDLRNIGVPEESIPRDPSQLANHHRHYKLQGQPVRSVATLLKASADRLTTWRGGAPRSETNLNPPPTEPRVEVNLNRDDRRRNIPQQPQRANVQPSQQLASPQTQEDSRRAAVKRAQAARG